MRGFGRNTLTRTLKKELKDFEKYIQTIRKFKMLDGSEIEPSWIQDEVEELDKMIRWERVFKDGIETFLHLWREPEERRIGWLELRFSDAERTKVALLNLKLLDSIDGDFNAETDTRFHEFLVNPEQERIECDWNDDSFPFLKSFIDEHEESLRAAFWKFLNLKEISPLKILQKLCSVLHLGFYYRNPSFSKYEAKKAEVRRRLVELYKIKKGLGLRLKDAEIEKKLFARLEKDWREQFNERRVCLVSMRLQENHHLQEQDSTEINSGCLEARTAFSDLAQRIFFFGYPFNAPKKKRRNNELQQCSTNTKPKG